jgi:FAD/FMN-containing dehydrogenase
MDNIRVNPEARTVRVGSDAMQGDMDHETQTFGLGAPGGVISTTGVTGLTLDEGFGWLSRKYGLAIDNLQSVNIVTADGKMRHTSEGQNEELFWGIRGGSSNFGIVTPFGKASLDRCSLHKYRLLRQ